MTKFRWILQRLFGIRKKKLPPSSVSSEERSGSAPASVDLSGSAPASEDLSGSASVPEEVLALRSLDTFLGSLLRADHYVAKSEYLEKLRSSEDLLNFFQVLKDSGTLQDFCGKNLLSQEEIAGAFSRCSSFSGLIDAKNEQYILEKLETERVYLDSILNSDSLIPT